MEPVANQGSKPVDLNDVEMIGSPNHAKPTGPDVHMIANERNHSIETFNDKSGVDEVETVPTQPLLEPDKEPQKPPLAGPESDDLEGDEKAGDNKTLISGIDDGLLDPEKKPDGIHGGNPDDPEKELVGDGVTTEDGKWWQHVDELDYPTFDGTNGISSRAHFDDRPQSPMIGSIPDVNTYQQKKNLAQGMMDLALLSANANQLRYVLESSASHPYYYSSLTFISLSIILQIGVGIGLIMNSRYNVKDEKDICKADKINNMTVLGVFLITITNVFITSFSVATPNSTTTAVQTTDGSG